MGFGVAFGTAPFGFVDSDEANAEPVPLHSSRRLTPDGQYVVLDTGEIAGMDDVQQRVILTCSFAIGQKPEFIDTPSLRRVEFQLRNALAANLKTDITVETVRAERGPPARIAYTVEYKNNLTNTKQTAKGSL